MYNTSLKDRIKGSHTILLLLVIIIAVFLFGCKPQASNTPRAEGKESQRELVGGERLFDKNCAKCHGTEGVGTDQGPPLVHKIYEPNHHADISFQLAVKRGVRSHHWGFGNMPRIKGVDEDDVAEIITYVRRLQRQARIY